MDPGSYRTGWGVLSGTSEKPRVIACGEVRMDKRAPFPDRLHTLQDEFTRIVRSWTPSAASVEAPFHGASARAALQLAHARGVILATLAAEHVPVIEYAPAVIKKTVAGSGRADKRQVQTMVRHALGGGAPRLTPDLADALAAALCHLAHARFEAALRGSESARAREGPAPRRTR